MAKIITELGENEEVILSINDHWVSLIKPFVTLVMAWLFYLVIHLGANLIQALSDSVHLGIEVIALFFLFCVHHFFFIKLLEWELSSFVVTTKKVIDFRNIPFYDDNVTFVMISEIDEIEKHKQGFIQNILNFGNIYINLAAIPEPFTLRHVPNPSKFVNLINAIREQKTFKEMDLNDFRALYNRKYFHLLQ